MTDITDTRIAQQQHWLTDNPDQGKTTLHAGSGACAEPDNPDLAPTLRVLQALAQCHEQTYRLYAAADRIRAGFSNLQAIVEISSPADIYEIERLRVTVERHAPVLDIVRNPTPVKVELVLSQTKDAAPIAA